MTGNSVEPEKAQNLNDRYGPDAHGGWCSEGQNGGELCGYDYAELSVFNDPLHLREIRVYSS